MIAFARKLAVAAVTFVCVCAAAPGVWVGAWAADPVDVFVDARDPAFIVLQGVAADAPEQARREMAGYATLENVSLIPWDAFRTNALDYIAPYIVKDDYAQSSTILGVVALIKAFPGRPFAVTWNGGLAVSFQDYQYAVDTHRTFLADADVWEQTRPRESENDPLDPARNIAQLLGQTF